MSSSTEKQVGDLRVIKSSEPAPTTSANDVDPAATGIKDTANVVSESTPPRYRASHRASVPPEAGPGRVTAPSRGQTTGAHRSTHPPRSPEQAAVLADKILDAAHLEASRIREQAAAEGDAVLALARREATTILDEARSEASRLRLAAPPAPVAPAIDLVPKRARAPRGRGAWGLLVHRRRYAILAVGMLVFALSGIFGPGVVSKLASGGFQVPGSESDKADRQIAQAFGRPGADIVALYHSDRYSVQDEQFKSAVESVVSQLPRDGVRSVSTYWSTQSPSFISRDGHSTYLAVQLTGVDEEPQLATFRQVRDHLNLSPGVGTTLLGGNVAVTQQISDQVEKDLKRAEMLSMPILFILLLVVFGSAVAAGLPLLVGGMTALASFVVLRLLMHVTEVSVFAVNVITILGLGLAIDYALLVVNRFREEIRAGHSTPDALSRTLTTAGRSIAVSAVIVAISLSGLLFFPEVFLRSMGIGGMSAVALAALFSLTVLPAILAIVGPRIDALRIPFLHRSSLTMSVRNRRGRHTVQRGRWERLAQIVMRRPWPVVTAVVLLLGILAAPVLNVKLGGIDARQLPTSAPGRIVAERLQSDFTGIQNDPIHVLVDGATTAQVGTLQSQIAAIPGASAVRVGGQSGNQFVITSSYPGESVDAQAREVVERIRDLDPPPGVDLQVGGVTAAFIDLRDSIGQGLWKMGLLIVAATFLVLFYAFGSVVVPLKAILINLLTISAAFGVVIWIFQEGNLSGLLDFTSTGTVETTQLILVLAVLFGLSTDYEIFLLSRIREEWDRSHDNSASVAHGMQRTGPMITQAALLILVVILAFSTSKITFIKLIGIGMAVSILLDATIMRGLLVPATMRLLGRANWWAPAPMLRWWEKHRPASEELAADEHH